VCPASRAIYSYCICKQEFSSLLNETNVSNSHVFSPPYSLPLTNLTPPSSYSQNQCPPTIKYIMDTKDQNASEEIQPIIEDAPVLCVKGCGFYGRKSTASMCSSCFKKSNVDVSKPVYIADSPALSASAPTTTIPHNSTAVTTSVSAPTDLLLLPPPQVPVQETAAVLPPPSLPIVPSVSTEDAKLVEVAERPVQKNKQR
jgi:hypothetical protein